MHSSSVYGHFKLQRIRADGLSNAAAIYSKCICTSSASCLIHHLYFCRTIFVWAGDEVPYVLLKIIPRNRAQESRILLPSHISHHPVTAIVGGRSALIYAVLVPMCWDWISVLYENKIMLLFHCILFLKDFFNRENHKLFISRRTSFFRQLTHLN